MKNVNVNDEAVNDPVEINLYQEIMIKNVFYF